MNRNIGIFCASSNRMEPVFYEEAKRLGEWIGRQGRTLVYGGANCGLMETLARSVHESGGRVLGVVPQILVDNNRVSGFIDEMVLTPDLNLRKQGIIDRSDIIIAMPGSVFWDELFQMFRGLERRNVINKPLSDYVLVANTFDELIRLVE